MLRFVSILVAMAMATSAWGGYRMVIHNVTHRLSDGFVITNELAQATGWYVTADQNGLLMQPFVVVRTFDDQAAGSNSVTLKNAKGKIVAAVEDKGLLGTADINLSYESFLIMFIKAGASDEVGEVLDRGNGSKLVLVTMSPATFGNGSQLILKFAGQIPERTQELVMNPALWGDGTQLTNLPGRSLGRVVYGQPGDARGQATITIDFELVEE